MKIPTLLVYVWIGLAVSIPSFSRAGNDCELKLEVDTAEWRGGTRGGYGVFEPGEYPQTVRFKVRLVAGAPCPFFVTFGSAIQGNSQRRAARGSDGLDYQVYASLSQRMVLKELPGAHANEVLRDAFGPGESVKELSYVIVVPPQQIKPSGRYTDVLRITVYQGTLDNYVQKDSKTVTFSVLVDEVAEMSITTAGSPFDPGAKSHAVDFGPLAKGKAKGFDVRVRSNVGYHVTLESENGGVMKNIDPQFKNTIPYLLQVGGKTVTLSSGRQTPISRYNRLTGPNGDRHEVQITVGDINNATAGTYRDHILVTVISDN